MVYSLLVVDDSDSSQESAFLVALAGIFGDCSPSEECAFGISNFDVISYDLTVLGQVYFIDWSKGKKFIDILAFL